MYDRDLKMVQVGEIKEGKKITVTRRYHSQISMNSIQEYEGDGLNILL